MIWVVVMKLRWFVVIGLVWVLSACTQKHYGPIYFFADLPGPDINIFSIDMNKTTTNHTTHRGSRDASVALDAQGNMVFASNRNIGPKKDIIKRPSARKLGSPQAFNIFYKASEQAEAQKILDTEFNETMVDISPDGQLIAFIRTLRDEQKHPYEELYVYHRGSAKLEKITQNDLVIGIQWAPVGHALLYSDHNYTEAKAQLHLYDADAGTTKVLLDTPWPNAQITSPQWSPDGLKVAFIRHPLGSGAVRTLFVLDLASSQLTELSGDGVQVQQPVSWSSRSDKIVYGGLVGYKEYWHEERREKVYEGGGELYIAALDGKVTQLTHGKTELFTRPVFSPDDALIAYMHSPDAEGKKYSLQIMTSTGKYKDTLYDKVAGVGYLLWP